MKLTNKTYDLESNQVEILKDLLEREIRDLKKLSKDILKEKPSVEYPHSFKTQEYEDTIERLHLMSFTFTCLGGE